MVTTSFTHHAAESGPAQGMTFTGRERVGPPPGADVDLPLVIALHGGGYTSAYFDVPGHSLVDRAGQLGIPIIAIDRPGYGGSSPVPGDGSILRQNAEIIDQLVGELWAEKGAHTTGVVLVGHSIGGAIALSIAARRPDWPLLGIAISGCLLRSPSGQNASFSTLPDAERIEWPPESKAALMFGPGWSRPAGMPEAAYFANAPIVKAELLEISSVWNDTVHDILPSVTTAVHLRQGEFDRLWVSTENEIAAFAGALSASPRVDARSAHGQGHAIDYHRGGFAFQLEQLAFALSCSAPRSPDNDRVR